jgi:hypothetical protein
LINVIIPTTTVDNHIDEDMMMSLSKVSANAYQIQSRAVNFTSSSKKSKESSFSFGSFLPSFKANALP